MLGCVARLAAHARHWADIAKVLLHAATKDTAPRPRAEALHSLFDAFAEPNVNAAVCGGN